LCSLTTGHVIRFSMAVCSGKELRAGKRLFGLTEGDRVATRANADRWRSVSPPTPYYTRRPVRPSLSVAAIETLQITLVYVCRTFSVFDVATLIDDAAARSCCRGGKTRAPANERAAFCFVVGFAARRKRCETSRSSVVRPGRQRPLPCALDPSAREEAVCSPPVSPSRRRVRVPREVCTVLRLSGDRPPWTETRNNPGAPPLSSKGKRERPSSGTSVVQIRARSARWRTTWECAGCGR